MDVFFEIQRGHTHIFLDLKESEKVQILKKMIHGILKVCLNASAYTVRRVQVDVSNQRLYTNLGVSNDTTGVGTSAGSAGDWRELEDDKLLSQCGFSSANARAQAPLLLALACYEGAGVWV
jgi:hypothetical protein